MAVNLTYDPSNDPETIEAEDQRDAESLEIGEQLAEEEGKLLAGKYKDAEDLEAAYIELQKKLGSNDDEPTEEAVEQEDEEDPFKDDPAGQAVFQAANDMNASGELSADTLANLEQITAADFVDAMARLEPEGDDAEPQAESVGLTDSNINDIQTAVGGVDAYNAMTSWAKDNFTPQEIQAYDNALEAGNMDNINLALQALYYRYTDSVGSEGEMIQGKASTAVDGFRSQAEVVRAMGDSRYDSDPAYRQDVYDKLERSNIKF